MTPEELKKPVTATEMGELQALINDINSVHFMKVLRRILWELEESRNKDKKVPLEKQGCYYCPDCGHINFSVPVFSLKYLASVKCYYCLKDEREEK